MAEKLNIPERGNEQSRESLEQNGNERRAEIEKSLEREAKNVEKADVEVLKQTAEKAAELDQKKPEKTVVSLEKRRDTPAQRRAKAKASYKKTMKETQAHMKPAERSFSKVIHNPAVEKTSEVVGASVARPNAILSGSVAAFLFTLGLYAFAKYYGYPLSGFETIAAFVLGWAVGLLIDYLRIMITGKKA